MKRSADDFAQPFLVRRAELDEAVLREEVKEFRPRALAGQHGAFRMAVPTVGTALKDAFEQPLLGNRQPFRAAEQTA